MQLSRKISVLIADDSLVFRRFLRDIFENTIGIEIIGEARDGIEALELVLKHSPDVILLDLEMPVMDGMTALQHLMIHCPTPTIMFSSLTSEGTARCFDTLKNGAVDFICKDLLFQEKNIEIYGQIVIQKVINAAGNTVRAIEPVFTLQKGHQARLSREKQIVFCEECGTRQGIDGDSDLILREIRCQNCGDVIEIRNHFEKFRRNNFISILAGGPGCYRNLLNIVPKLDADMGGALIVVIFDENAAVNSFAEYLNSICSMKVIRARENMSIDGGNCYIVSGTDSFGLKPYSANYSFQQLLRDDGKSSLDLLLSSTAAVFRNRTAGIILSGDAHAGTAGMQVLVEAQGTALMMDPAECYCKGLGAMIRSSCPSIISLSENDLIAQIQALHYGSKRTVTAA